MAEINFDQIDTYLPSVNKIIGGFLTKSRMVQVCKFEPEYLDTASDFVLENCDIEGLFLAVNRAIASSSVHIFHATRLTEVDEAHMHENGFLPLQKTSRIERLKSKIKKYCTEENLRFDESRFQFLVDEFQDRDNGTVFFSISRDLHLKGNTNYLHFGSEFEQVIVVHLLHSRSARNLLKIDSSAAFIHWTVDGTYLDLEITLNAVNQVLESGNMPSLATRMINNWVLWKSGNGSKIGQMDKDYSVLFRLPFPPRRQKIEFLSEKQLGRISV